MPASLVLKPKELLAQPALKWLPQNYQVTGLLKSQAVCGFKNENLLLSQILWPTESTLRCSGDSRHL